MRRPQGGGYSYGRLSFRAESRNPAMKPFNVCLGILRLGFATQNDSWRGSTFGLLTTLDP